MNRNSYLVIALLCVISFMIQACDNSPLDPQLGAALQQNGSVNALYAKFLSEANEKTLFEDYFRTYATVAKTKQELNQRLQAIQPTSRYWSLYQRLVVSIQSDEKLMAVEEKSLRQTLDSLRVMQNMAEIMETSQAANAHLPAEERKRKAGEALQKVRDLTSDWRNVLAETGAELETAKKVSSEAVNLLNEEIERLGLPHKHENPFTKGAAAPPAEK